MGWLKRAANSSIGAKWIMAITGTLLFGFLIGHLAGNLLVFSGPQAFNDYAAGLRELPYGLLWVARIGLVILFVLHIFTSIKLTRMKQAARPVPYAFKNTIKATLGSRTMGTTGLLVLLFLLYHLAHFTWYIVADTGQRYDELGRHDAYTMVIEGFRQPAIAISYIAAMLVLAVHLGHGLSSLFQTFGINNKKYNFLFRCVAPAVAWGLSLAFISIPVAIWLNLVGA